jgi:hypothetical protein
MGLVFGGAAAIVAAGGLYGLYKYYNIKTQKVSNFRDRGRIV